MRLLVLAFLALIAAVGYLAYLNPLTVTLFYTRDASVETSLTALVLLAMAAGGLLVMLAAGFIETRNLFVTWRQGQARKRGERVRELLEAGGNAKASGRLEEAAGYFQKVLQFEPHHVQALLRLGEVSRLQGNPHEAIRLHRRARDFDPKNVESSLALARDYENANQLDDAVSTLEATVKLDAGSLTALMRLRDLNVRLERWDEALAVQEKIMPFPSERDQVERETGFLTGIKYELGRIALEQGGMDKARRAFRGAIKINKNFLPAYIGLGEVLVAEGKLKDAGDLWEKAYEMTGNVILLHRLEELYLELGQPPAIIRLYESAVRRDPTNPALQFYLGKLYYRLEMVDEAFGVLSGIDTADARIPDLYKILGNLFLRKGDSAQAIECFKRALNLRKRVLVPYYCPSCDFHTTEWAGRCARCGAWNTYSASPILGEWTPAKVVARYSV